MLGIIALRQGYDYIQQGETASCLTGKDADLVHQDAQRKFKEAEQYFKKAVALQPEFPMAWNNLSVTALQLGDWPAAAKAAEQAIKDSTYTEPETARANLGWAHLQMKDTQKAWKELHEAVSRVAQVLRRPLPAGQGLLRAGRPGAGRRRTSTWWSTTPAARSRRPTCWPGWFTSGAATGIGPGACSSAAPTWPRAAVPPASAGGTPR